ncbi:MAG: hypothetical protein WC635_14940 [Bacteriovorax sp.]
MNSTNKKDIDEQMDRHMAAPPISKKTIWRSKRLSVHFMLSY